MYVYMYATITKTRKSRFWGKSGSRGRSKRKWKKDVILKQKQKRAHAFNSIGKQRQAGLCLWPTCLHIKFQDSQGNVEILSQKTTLTKQTNHTHMFPRLVRWLMGKSSKPEELSSILRIHMVWENWLLWSLRASPLLHVQGRCRLGKPHLPRATAPQVLLQSIQQRMQPSVIIV